MYGPDSVFAGFNFNYYFIFNKNVYEKFFVRIMAFINQRGLTWY